MMRLSMSHTKNFIDNKIEAIQARWSSSKPDGRNSRTLERETFFEKFGTLFKQRSTHFLLQSKIDVSLQDETGGTQELIVNSTKPQINPSAAVTSEGTLNVSPGNSSIDALYDEDAISSVIPQDILLENGHDSDNPLNPLPPPDGNPGTVHGVGLPMMMSAVKNKFSH